MNAKKSRVIILTKAEVQSGLNRQKWAENLILQLPETHDGRNSWLLNYGISDEARKLQEKHGITWDEDRYAAKAKDKP